MEVGCNEEWNRHWSGLWGHIPAKIDYILVIHGTETKFKAGSVEMSEVKNLEPAWWGSPGCSWVFLQPRYGSLCIKQ